MASAAIVLADGEPPRPEGEARGLVVACLVALALHGGAVALIAAWRSTAAVSPPGEQTVTIDLAPQMVEAPSVAPVETSVPAGLPGEITPIAPLEAVTAQPVAPEPPVERRPVEEAAVPPPVEALPPPPPETVAQVESMPPAQPPPAIVETAPAPSMLAEAVLSPDAAPIGSTAAQALVLPPPETSTARPLPEPAPIPKPAHKALERKPAAKPEPRRDLAQREKPRPVQPAARPGAGGQSQRDAQRGASSRENMSGAAAAAVDPTAMSRYAAQLAAALKSRLRYPEAARAAGVSGSATVRFTLHRSGRVMAASLMRSAGHPALDAAALATAAPGSSLPPAPDGVPQQQLTIAVPLRFDMR